MNYKYLLSYLYGILAFFSGSTAAREAIVGGKLADANEFRYQVMIIIADQAPSCGGGIIDEYSIITAANCLVGPNGYLFGRPIHILAGTVDLGSPGIVIEVNKIFYLKAFKPQVSTFEKDIAVLKLKAPLELEKHNLTKLKLPTDCRRYFTNKSAIIAGTGWDWVETKNNKTTGGPSDTHLRYIQTDIFDHEDCVRHHPDIQINRYHLCARVKQRRDHSKLSGVCIGDGGGPLVYGGKLVIGILSLYKSDCSEKNSSAIYTRITQYLTFIKNAMRNVESRYMRMINV